MATATCEKHRATGSAGSAHFKETGADAPDGSESFGHDALALELAGAAHGFRSFSDLAFRGFLVRAMALHFAPDALALHLLLKRLQGTVDVVVADKNLHWLQRLLSRPERTNLIASRTDEPWTNPKGIAKRRACLAQVARDLKS